MTAQQSFDCANVFLYVRYTRQTIWWVYAALQHDRGQHEVEVHTVWSSLFFFHPLGHIASELILTFLVPKKAKGW